MDICYILVQSNPYITYIDILAPSFEVDDLLCVMKIVTILGLATTLDGYLLRSLVVCRSPDILFFFLLNLGFFEKIRFFENFDFLKNIDFFFF